MFNSTELDGSPEAYEATELAMCDVQPLLPSAAVILNHGVASKPNELDSSFVSQLRDIHLNPQSLDEELTLPDAYLATARSAVPVLASIKGALDALGLPKPYMGYIKANVSLSRFYFRRDDVSSYD